MGSSGSPANGTSVSFHAFTARRSYCLAVVRLAPDCGDWYNKTIRATCFRHGVGFFASVKTRTFPLLLESFTFTRRTVSPVSVTPLWRPFSTCPPQPSAAQGDSTAGLSLCLKAYRLCCSLSSFRRHRASRASSYAIATIALFNDLRPPSNQIRAGFIGSCFVLSIS